jgi:hypothetical protein
MERGHVQHTKDGQRTTVNSIVDYVVCIFVNQMRNYKLKKKSHLDVNTPLILRNSLLYKLV